MITRTVPAYAPARGPDAGDVPRDEHRGGAEPYATRVRPDRAGAGIGRALLAGTTARATADGCRDTALRALREDTPARRFCDCAGFRPDRAEDSFEAGGALVPEVRYVGPLGPPAAG